MGDLSNQYNIFENVGTPFGPLHDEKRAAEILLLFFRIANFKDHRFLAVIQRLSGAPEQSRLSLQLTG